MSGIMNLPEDERDPKTKLKAAVNNPQRTIPGRIGTPKPIPAGQRSIPEKRGPVKFVKRTTPDPIGPLGVRSRNTGPISSKGLQVANFREGDRALNKEDDPRRKAILKRLRMRQNAKQQKEADA